MTNLFLPFGSRVDSGTFIEDAKFKSVFSYFPRSRRCQPISGGSGKHRLGEFRLIKQASWVLV